MQARTCVCLALVGSVLKTQLLPGVAVAIELGGQRGHDVSLALNALLAALNVLDHALPVVQLLVPLPEHLQCIGHQIDRLGGYEPGGGYDRM